jgi:lysophospholipid acyltransferase (LPLAT)-like uncharacterized protein
MATHPQRPRQSGVIVPQKASWSGRLAAWLIWLLISSLGATIRLRVKDGSGKFVNAPLRDERQIFCVWHNRLALCLKMYERLVRRRQPHRRMAAIVSASKDGGMLARVLEHFGVQPVRGSSSRRGAQALLELTSWAERGLDLAITPDGPRGPRYVIQDGPIAMAGITGLPIVPASYHLNWKWTLKSWDKFQIPLPFAVCTLRIGEFVHVPRETTAEEREKLRKLLEDRMREITED